MLQQILHKLQISTLNFELVIQLLLLSTHFIIEAIQTFLILFLVHTLDNHCDTCLPTSKTLSLFYLSNNINTASKI